MNSNDLPDDKYSRLLEELMQQIKQEIQSVTADSCGSIGSLEQLDRYLQEVNSYYYQTFHQSFFPQYRRSLQEDLYRSQTLAGHEELLIQHIAATIKRYTGLYNQIKTNRRNIQILHEQAAQEQQFLNSNNSRRVLELMYGIKSLFENIQALFQLSDGLLQLSLPELNNPIDPDSRGFALRSLCSRKPIDEVSIPTLNRILKTNHYIRNLLQQIKGSGPMEKDVLQQIQHALESSITSSPDIPWGRFYIHQVAAKSRNYLELLTLNLEADKPARAQQLVHEFHEHLSRWMLFFDQIVTRISSPYFYLLPELYELETAYPGYLQELQKDIISHRDAVEVIIQKFHAAEELDFAYFNQEILKMLEFTAPFFASIGSEAVPCPALLDRHLHRVDLCLKSLTLQRETLEEDYWHYQKLSSRIEEFMNGLTEHMKLWENILNDLDRLLAPRNISRLWKGITIKLTHIPLCEGKPIPPEYQYLMNKHHISTRLSDEDDYTVLHQEGDVFIIQVEQLIVEEIPYLIISRKG